MADWVVMGFPATPNPLKARRIIRTGKAQPYDRMTESVTTTAPSAGGCRASGS